MSKHSQPDHSHHRASGKGDFGDDEGLQQQAAEYLAGWQRAKADYLNLKKETDQRLATVGRYAKEGLLTDFLPVYANLSAAFQHIPEAYRQEDWAVGFGHVKKQLEDFLSAQGLVKIPTVGQQFDHRLHDAVETRTDPEKPDGEILQELKAGYTMDGDVVVHPQVVVNRLAEEDHASLSSH